MIPSGHKRIMKMRPTELTAYGYFQGSSIRQPVRRAIERQQARIGRRIRNEMQEYAYSHVFQGVKSAKLASLGDRRRRASL